MTQLSKTSFSAPQFAKAFDHSRYRPTQPVQLTDRKWPEQQLTEAPLWCSVDLRDGNQALAKPMSVSQKQRFWKLLIAMGFKQIEVGFPSASQPDFDFVRWLIEENQIPDDVTIQVLVQAREELIARTYEALEGAARAIVHVYNSTSPVQRQKVFNLDKAGITEIARRGAQLVKEYAERYPQTEWTFQYSPESFSSTEVDFATDVCSVVINEWQPANGQPVIINLPATVECSTPNIFADQVEWFCRHVSQRDHILVSIHTHNDRGCAVAAAELAILAGADRIEGTLLGNGERTGNMDIITMAMNFYSQGIDPKLDLSAADEIIKVVTECTDLPIHPRHPWFGDLVYTAFSGSHQDAIRKCLAVQQADEAWDVAYLPINPQDLGREYQSVIRVNSQSGKGGAAYWVEQTLGLELPRWLQQDFAGYVQQASEESADELSPSELVELFIERYTGPLEICSSRSEQQHDEVHLKLEANIESANYQLVGRGVGNLNALINALNEQQSSIISLVEYDECRQSIDDSEGSSADLAFCMTKLAIDGQEYCACASDADILQAGLKAVLTAYQRYKSSNINSSQLTETANLDSSD